jgi:hypothetical protein
LSHVPRPLSPTRRWTPVARPRAGQGLDDEESAEIAVLASLAEAAASLAAQEITTRALDVAQIRDSRREQPVAADSRARAASRPVADAGVTRTDSSSPRVSVSRCRLRPLIFFPVSKPRGEGDDGVRLHRLRVDDRRTRFLITALGIADGTAQPVVQLGPESRIPPAGEEGVHPWPWREGQGHSPPLTRLSTR